MIKKFTDALMFVTELFNILERHQIEKSFISPYPPVFLCKKKDRIYICIQYFVKEFFIYNLIIFIWKTVLIASEKVTDKSEESQFFPLKITILDKNRLLYHKKYLISF